MLYVGDVPVTDLESLLTRYGLELVICEDGTPIKGSFWGDNEAGIVRNKVFARNDTPVHSLLHEAGHIICMSADRREVLERDAGGDDLEESAVCYLQVLLADAIPGAGRERIMRDMDEWGYSFRLGSTGAWFREDAGDAQKFLFDHRLIAEDGTPTFALRG